MLDRRRFPPRRVTLAAGRGYDRKVSLKRSGSAEVTPHIAQHTSNRRSAIDGRTTRHPGYALSQHVRKRDRRVLRLDEDTGGGRKLCYIGRAKTQLWATFTVVALNLVGWRTSRPNKPPDRATRPRFLAQTHPSGHPRTRLEYEIDEKNLWNPLLLDSNSSFTPGLGHPISRCGNKDRRPGTQLRGDAAATTLRIAW